MHEWTVTCEKPDGKNILYLFSQERYKRKNSTLHPVKHHRFSI